MDLELGGDVTGDDLGGEAPRGLGPAPIDHCAIDDEGDPLGTAEVEVVADGRLEPGPGPARLVEHRGVGDLELGDGEGPVEAGPAIVGRQRIGTTAIMRARRPRRWPEPRRAQMRCAAAGSSTQRNPLSRASKPMPALASWHLAHSWPLAQHHSG